MLRALFFLLAIVVASPTLGEKAKEIPLKDIWAYKMPGTRAMTDNTKDGEFVSKEGPVLREIRQALKYRGGKASGPGFVVQGSGRETLPKVLEVLRGYLSEEEPSEPKPMESGEEVTLVFFAYRSGSYVHLEKVEVEGKAIIVKYRFVRHITANLSEHIALIPLGKLEPGKYSVEIQQSMEEANNVEKEMVDRLIAKSFTFEVVSRAGEGVTEIPLKDVWAHDMPGTKNIRDLEPDVFGAPAANLSSREWRQRSDKSLLSKSLRPLADLPEREAGRGFAVQGIGLEALRNASSILAKDAEPSQVLPSDVDISLVFFSHMNNSLVHIAGIERSGSDIEVKYKFIPRFEAQRTVNLALIPLGKLPPGTFSVKMIALPIEQKFIDLGIAPVSPEHEARVVCRPFHFEVESDQ